jgi:hypothetical protein
MTLPAIRPEDRRREAVPRPCDEAQRWAACRRSEGFAEDLPLPLPPVPPQPAALWRGAAAASGLGLVLTTMLGVLAR